VRGPATAELLAALARFALREGEFTLASGRVSKWYLDARQVTYRGDCLETVGRAVLEAVDGLAFDAVGGLTLGADPVALAVAACSGRRAFAVRKEAKGHGASGRMAGPIKEGDRVLVVDDAVTTGGSTLAALDAIVDYGGVVIGASCLLDRGGELGAALKERGIPFFPVLGAPDLGFAYGS
jgi:orotate phosphoribosyltransferase